MSNRPRTIRPVLFLVLILSIGTAAAAAELDDFSKGLLDRAQVVAAAKAVTAEAYPNSDDALVDDHILVRYNADGTAVTWDDTFVKVLTEKGKRGQQTLSFGYTIPYSTVAVALLEVLKPDGTVVPVDVTSNSRVMVSSDQMASNIYDPNDKTLTVNVPGLEIGDMVRYVSCHRETKTRVPDTWSDYQVFEYTSPIKHHLYEVFGPAARPLKSIALKAEVPGTVTYTHDEKDGVLHYRWEVRDVPRMYEEPDMPALHTVVQRLLVSTVPDWRDISRWYWNLSKPHIEKTTPEMEAKVADLIRGIDGPREKIEAIFKYVSQDIRYMGITIEKEAPGYEPHDVSLTFDNKYGVCRDKAALLVALLRIAGFDAFPVLIHAGPKKDPEVPTPYFNHAISCVRNPEGTYTLMDSTDENTRELLPAYLGNKSYLVATPEGETLQTSPVDPAETNLVRIETTGRVDAEGNLDAQSVIHFDRINDNAYRGYFSRVKPEEVRRYFEGKIKVAAAGSRLTRFEIEPENMMDTSMPLTVRIGFEAKDILISGETEAMLPSPRLGASIGMVNFILDGTGLEKRKYTLETSFACGVRETVALDLDERLARSPLLPAFQPIESKEVAWTRTASTDGARLIDKSEFMLKVPEFDPEQYLGLKHALKVIEENDRKVVILKPSAEVAAPTGVDVVVLYDGVNYDLADAHNWTETETVRLKVLTYAGKKRYAELKLAFNPAWEKVEVERASVTSSDGKESRLGEQELNLMDAPWVGDAPRYPAGKLLVASLPAVEIGSEISYRVKRTRKDRPFFAMHETFRSFEPIVRKTVRVVAPEGVAFKALEMNLEGVAKTESADAGKKTRTTEWRAENMAPVKQEPFLPPLYSFVPAVFGSAGDWPAYAAEVARTLAAAATGQARAEAKAREVAAAAATPEAKVLAIRDFVAKNVRAAGPGLDDLPLSAVTAADKTLEEGYGNSTDRAVLLDAMLAAAGVAPEFVLSSSAPMVEGLDRPLSECPDPSWFGGVLVRVRLGDRAAVLNDTDQYAALGVTAHEGRPCLVLPAGRVEVLAAPPGMGERAEVAYRIAIARDGDAVITRERRYFGTEYGAQRKRFAEMPPEELRRYHQRTIASISQAGTAVGPLVTEFEKYPGVERFSLKVEKYAVLEAGYCYFELPESLAAIFDLHSDERTGPLYRERPYRRTIATTIEVPLGFTIVPLVSPERNAFEENLAWLEQAHDGAISETPFAPAPPAQGEAAGGLVLRSEQSAALAPSVIPAADYRKLLEIQRELSHPRSKTVLMRVGSAN